MRALATNRLSIHQLRQMALGEKLTKWSAETEPKLMRQTDDLMDQVEQLMGETRQDLLRLTLMDTVEEGSESKRTDEIYRLAGLLDKLSTIKARELDGYMKLSAGGAASLWASMQKIGNSPPPETVERNATPARRFGAQRDAQVIDTE